MDITDFDKMEQEAASRLFSIQNNCPNCQSEMIDKKSKIYGNYKHCKKCNKNWKLKTPAQQG